MEIFRKLDEVPANFGSTVVSVGNFDGVHRAHQHVLAAIVRRTRELGARSLAVTFDPHPMRIRRDPVSSSRIRELVIAGRVGRARQLLGRVFSVLSTPGRGRGYGQKYTVPTINLSRYEEVLPADGVYITRSRIGEQCFDSVTNIGQRPTFGSESFAVETHLLGFHPLALTPETEVEISFLRRLRDEIKFPSVDALRQQIARDVHRVRRFLRLLKKEE